MKWIKYIFIVILFLLALPMWRLIDWAVVTFAQRAFFVLLISMWSGLFIALPFKLLSQRIPRWFPIFIILTFGIFAWVAQPLSNQATLEPSLSHCSFATYTGFFYPARKLLSNVHQDDLEVRNQMCWVRKMIQRVPAKISQEDLQPQLELLKKKLLKPQFKYRSTLPGILFLVGTYLSAGLDDKNSLDRMRSGKMFVDSLEFWSKQYSEEISGREYAWYEWPHSSYIQFEYGIIEKNWDKIHLEFNQ